MASAGNSHATGSGIAIAMLAGISLLALATSLHAQPVAEGTGQRAASAVGISVPAGSLEAALLSLGRQAGLRLVYPSEITRGRTTGGAAGNLTPEQALSRLLAGTGLSWSFTGANTVTITDRVTTAHAAPVNADGSLVLDTINVAGGGGAFSADEPYRTAGSSTYISGENIERFRGTSPADMLRSVPGLTTTGTRNGGAINANIRGMQDMDRVPVVVDGALQSQTEYRGYAGAANRSYVDPDFIGGVSVERGPSMGADASGATGGVVRMRTLNAADIVQPGKNWGVRVKGGYTNNSVSPPPARTTGGMIIRNLPSGPVLPEYIENTPFFTEGNFDRPALLNPSAGNGSIAAAYSDDRFEFVGAYARRNQGNYFAGTKGDDAAHLVIEPGYAPGRVMPRNGGISGWRAGEEVLNTSNDSESWLAKGALKLDGGHRIEVSYMRYGSVYGEILPSNASGIFDFGIPQYPLSDVTVDTYTGTWTWDPDDNDLIDLRLNVWKTSLEQTIRSSIRNTDGTYTDTDDHRFADRWGGSLENRSIFDTRFGEFTLSYGASYNHADVETYFLSTYPDGRLFEGPVRAGWRREASAFFSSQYKPTDWLSLETGLRYTRTDSHDECRSGRNARNCHPDLSTDGWAPVASVTVEPWQGVQGYVRYAEGIRSPSIYEAIGSSSFGFGAFPTRPLKPEHAKNWEIGANFMRDDVFVAGDKLRFKAAWFNNSIDDYLTRRTGERNRLIMTNLKSARFEGIELSGSYDNGRLFGDLAYTHYLSSEFCLHDEDWPLPGSAARDAPQCSDGGTYQSFASNHVPPKDKLSLTLGTRLLDEKLTLGGRVTYVGKRMSSSDGSGRMIVANWNPYTLVDLFASYKVNENFQIDAAIDNVGDRFYIDALEDGFSPGPGRTFRLNMTARF